MIDFDSLKELSLPEFDADGYIYYLFYKGVLIYVGQSISLTGRIASHRGNKKFDKVLYEACQAEKLKDREREVIQHYRPILNGEYGSKPDKKALVVGDHVFIHKKKLCFRISGIELYSEGGLVGFINEEKIYWISYESYYEYIFAEDVINKHHFAGLNQYTRIFDVYYFDKDLFQFKPRSVVGSNKSEVVVGKDDLIYSKAISMKAPRLPQDYVFHYGKYNNKSVSDVKLINEGYIFWFETNVPVDQW